MSGECIPFIFSKAQKPQKRNTIINIGFLLILIFGFPARGWATEPNDPKPGETLRYDSKNSLRYDVPQKGDVLRFNYSLDGTSQTWNMGISSNFKLPISNVLIYGIHYVSPERIWLVTHVGKRFAGAVRINLKTRQVEKGYAINGPYAISPDGLNLAYLDTAHNVLINNVAVYPAVQIAGNPTDDPAKWLTLEEEGSTPPKHSFEYQVSRVFNWKNNDTFRFIVQVKSAKDSSIADGQYYECTINGLQKALSAQPTNTDEIKFSGQHLGFEEAEQRIKAANEAHAGKKTKTQPSVKKQTNPAKAEATPQKENAS